MTGRRRQNIAIIDRSLPKVEIKLGKELQRFNTREELFQSCVSNSVVSVSYESVSREEANSIYACID